jgi:hypothetical protein
MKITSQIDTLNITSDESWKISCIPSLYARMPERCIKKLMWYKKGERKLPCNIRHKEN